MRHRPRACGADADYPLSMTPGICAEPWRSLNGLGRERERSLNGLGREREPSRDAARALWTLTGWSVSLAFRRVVAFLLGPGLRR